MELEEAVVAQIEALAGGTVVRVEHQGRWRPHFFVDVKQPSGELVPLLVRFPRDPELVAGSAFLSHFDLAHEAKILAALQGKGIQVPRMLGFIESAPAIVMERIEGTNDLDGTTPDQRETILREYFDNIHRLHNLPIDVDELAAAGLTVPQTVDELALTKIGLMERDFAAARPHLLPEPLLDFAIWWLHRNVPQHRTEPRWVQGDTGPGQFMVDGGRLTALIDWELSHIADPMLDLGVLRMRNQLYPLGEINEYLDYYASLGGKPVDREALCFYTVLSMLLSPLGMAMSVQRPDAGVGSMLPRFGWDVTLRRGLCDALCEAYGVEVDPPDIPTIESRPRTDLEHFLVQHLTDLCLPMAHDDYESFNLRGAIGVAQTVELSARLGARLRSDDVEDMSRVLGGRPDDWEAGMATLAELVAKDPEPHVLDLLWLFSRMEQRREHLWRPMMIAQDSRPFERYFPAERTLAGPEPR